MLFILWLIDRNFVLKFQNIRQNPVFLAVLAFFVLHVIGLAWLEAPEPVNGFKSWMVFLIPVLATAVDTKTAKRGIYAFVVAMMIAESYVYANILANWDAYINLQPFTPLIEGRYFISGSRVSYNPMLAFAIALLLATLLAGLLQKGFATRCCDLFSIDHGGQYVHDRGPSGSCSLYLCLARSVSLFPKRPLGCSGGDAGVLVVILTLAFSYSPVFKSRIMQAQSDLMRYQDHKLVTEDTSATGTSVGLRLHFTEHTLIESLNRPWFGMGRDHLSMPIQSK